jgi:hypothetical protein
MLQTVGGFRYIEALCPLSWKVYGNESTVQTCMDQILTLQRDARAGVHEPANATCPAMYYMFGYVD